MEPFSGESSLEAQQTFAQYVARVEAGEDADFAALCRDHPGIAQELCALHAQWKAGGILKRSGDDESSSEQGHRPGSKEDSRISVEGRADLGFAETVLRRLAARGDTYGRYRIGGEIAKGGQGAVLRVWDEDLHRHLAMKVLLEKGGVSSTSAPPRVEARSLGRFLEEAQVTGQLDHPGIVPVHELGLDSEEHVYFTMKLVKGRTLKEVFELVAKGEEGWTRTRALSVLLKVCEAMAYAHAKGVIHRDLKPGNVMVGRYGEVYVMDWGLARVLGHEDRKDIRIRHPIAVSEAVHSERHEGTPTDSPLITMDGDVVGTPSYMSPEQALGRLDEVGPHSDVYSAGAMLYHLLAGHAPYVQPGMRVNNHGIWYQVQKGPPSPLHARAPDAPAELVAICEKAMARDWRSRYGDTSKLAEDLSAFIEHRVVHAYQTGAVAELRKWIVRNKGLASAVAAGMVVLVAWLATSLALKAVAENRLENLVRLSAQQNLEDLLARADKLWPVQSANIDAYRTWMGEARVLVADLPLHRARRAELRQRALPWTEEERLAQRESSPDASELARLEGEIACQRRALLQRRDGVREKVPEIDWSAYPADASRLNDLARQLVEPRRERFGEEPLGLALALRARSIAPDDPDVTRTAAWAYFALGRDDDALNTASAALDSAPQERKEEFEESLALLDLAVAAASNEAEMRRIEDELPALEDRRLGLEARVNERGDWRFPEREPEARWWNNQLTKLIDGLETLERELLAEQGMSSEHGWSVPRRLAFAERLRDGYAPGGEYAVAWEEALPAIGEAYPGLALRPQLGLVPIGPDSLTGLWEFAHFQTGEIPRRDEQGKLTLTEETGLVFVLLPGATFTMGAQKSNPAGPNYDPLAEYDEGPVNEVKLSSFFLSKYEMTQGQWLRFTGSNPSEHPPGHIPGGLGDLLHPVEKVSWYDCDETLSRLGLLLPTEAQWEYAARAGTSTPWWTGERRESLRGSTNLADRSAKVAGAPWSTPEDWPDLDDGYAVHGPVNAFGTNPFGLHNVQGNVFEWCRGGDADYKIPAREGDGGRGGTYAYRMYRGGGFNETASHARSACRRGDVPVFLSHWLGLRPARAIEQ